MVFDVTLGLERHTDIIFLKTLSRLDQTSNHNVKWAVSLVITDGHASIPQGFVWICMGKYTDN